MSKVKIECGSCRSTGLYSGFAEPEGTAVPCGSCDGLGYQEAESFTRRKKKKGIQKVLLRDGPWTARNPKKKSAIIPVGEWYEKTKD